MTATSQHPTEFVASFHSFRGQAALARRAKKQSCSFLSFFFFSSSQGGAAPAQPPEKTGERRHKRPIRVCSSTRERPHLGCGAAFAKRMPAHGGRRSCPERLGLYPASPGLPNAARGGARLNRPAVQASQSASIGLGQRALRETAGACSNASRPKGSRLDPVRVAKSQALGRFTQLGWRGAEHTPPSTV